MEAAIPAGLVNPSIARPTPESICAHANRVYRFAAMVARGDVEAEDLAQDALLRAIQHRRSFDARRGTLESWLWRIVVNAARDAGRVSARRLALWERLRGDQPEPASIENLAMDRLADQQLLAAVRALPKRDRALIALRHGADLDYNAIANLIGLSPGATTMATRRALDRLRKQLEATTND